VSPRPFIRESGGDRSAVTGGTKVLSDRVVIKRSRRSRASLHRRMIALVEGAARQKTPNEIALNILLASLTIVFLLAVATLPPFADYAGTHLTMNRAGGPPGLPHPDHHRALLSRSGRGHGTPGAAHVTGHVRQGS